MSDIRFETGADGFLVDVSFAALPPVECDQCEPLMINGVFCHESGCLNRLKTWVPERGWVRFVDCRDCGYPVEDGEACDCQTEIEP